MKNLFLILTAFLLLGCRESSEDDATKLPPETQTGANTFGCLVNGRLFYPRDGTPSVGSDAKGLIVVGGKINNESYIEIEADNFKDGKPINYFTIHLQALDSKGAGTYNLNQTNFHIGVDGIADNYFLLRAFDYNEGVWKWYGSYDGSGTVVITNYNKNNHIISGTFSGKLKTQDGKSEVDISQGRFDINTYTLYYATFP